MTLVQIKQAAALRLQGKKDAAIAHDLKVSVDLIRRHTNAIQFECGLMMARAH